LLAPAGNDRLLEDELEEVGERLQHAPRPDDVRPAAQVDRTPDLALGVNQHRGRKQDADQQQQALEQVANEDAERRGVHPTAEGGAPPSKKKA
jgi:hypothetical protein